MLHRTAMMKFIIGLPATNLKSMIFCISSMLIGSSWFCSPSSLTFWIWPAFRSSTDCLLPTNSALSSFCWSFLVPKSDCQGIGMLQGNDESVAKDSWLRKCQLSLFLFGKGFTDWKRSRSLGQANCREWTSLQRSGSDIRISVYSNVPVVVNYSSMAYEYNGTERSSVTPH